MVMLAHRWERTSALHCIIIGFNCSHNLNSHLGRCDSSFVVFQEGGVIRNHHASIFNAYFQCFRQFFFDFVFGMGQSSFHRKRSLKFSVAHRNVWLICVQVFQCSHLTKLP